MNENILKDEKKIEIIENKSWKLNEKQENSTDLLFFPISGINNIGINEIKSKLIGLTLTTTVRKELVELSKELKSILDQIKTKKKKRKELV